MRGKKTKGFFFQVWRKVKVFSQLSFLNFLFAPLLFFPLALSLSRSLALSLSLLAIIFQRYIKKPLIFSLYTRGGVNGRKRETRGA